MHEHIMYTFAKVHDSIREYVITQTYRYSCSDIQDSRYITVWWCRADITGTQYHPLHRVVFTQNCLHGWSHW